MAERIPPRLINLRTASFEDLRSPNGIYIGRPSKWGNIFTHVRSAHAKFVVPSREAAIYSYERWIRGREQKHLLDSIDELTGGILRCYCSPLPCHGDVLIKLWKERFS